MPNHVVDKILYGIFSLLICAGIGLLYKFYTLKGDAQHITAPIAVGPLVKPSERTRIKGPKTGVKNPKALSKEDLPPLPKMDQKRELELKSQVIKRRFAKKVFLDIPLPGHLKYIPLDLGEKDTEAIYGYNHLSKEGLTAAARKGDLSMKEIQQYLKEGGDAIPNLKGNKLSNMGPVKSIKVKGRKEGVSSIEVMGADTESGQRANVALVNRTDKKGSYVFIYTGPKKGLAENDGYLDQIFHQMKVLDAKSGKK